MIEREQTGAFLTRLRQAHAWTQKDVASRLHVSAQAVSKWENGLAVPPLDLLLELSRLYGVTMEEIANGRFEQEKIDHAHLDVHVERWDRFNEESHPDNVWNPSFRGGVLERSDGSLLVSRTLEPGAKQHLAFEQGALKELVDDALVTLDNDWITMNARPLALTMTILSGQEDLPLFSRLTTLVRTAGRKQGMPLIEAQRSVKPFMKPEETQIVFTGIGEAKRPYDARRIEAGDSIYYWPSNGLHHHGFTIMEALLERRPEWKTKRLLDELLKAPVSYAGKTNGYEDIKCLVHITQFGLERNVRRVLKPDQKAVLELDKVKIPPVFHWLKRALSYSDAEMMKTFNCGMGMLVIAKNGDPAYRLGQIESRNDKEEAVVIHSPLHWE
ncbi:helix-turn-helix domain-containing protein [uncultured Dubosiella sp.]|uniref:helix-turn-helix domain-containing protein n=1 Tax=uncultured Dubosiella sp. TaxID=1937011 RepID=UPI002730253F|nr:helix-turn-helix domain-containing protein [uncultured Dubosiella sp.]